MLLGKGLRGDTMFVGSVGVGTMLKEDNHDVNVAIRASEMKRCGTGCSDDRFGGVSVLVAGISEGQPWGVNVCTVVYQ